MNKTIIGIFIWLGILTSLIAFLSCKGIQKPDRKDFELTSGYMYALCMWYNAESKEKVDCTAAFTVWSKEHSFTKCLKEENRPNKMTFDSCIKYLD